MKKFLLLLLFTIPIQIIAQKKIDAEITMDNGEVIKTKIRVFTYSFMPDVINELSFGKKIITFDKEDDRDKIKSKDIKQLKFTDFQNKQRIFVNTENSKDLKELMYDGKIKWYRDYYAGGYDGGVQYDDEFVNEKNEKVEIGILNNKSKKLKEITSSKPGFDVIVDSADLSNINGILSILKKYDEI